MTAAASKYTPTCPASLRKASGNRPGATVATTLKRYAIATPIEMSVHILGCIARVERTPRTKNGHAHQSTTGVASASSVHWLAAGLIHDSNG
jgi:hypothetical protein